MNTNSIQSFKPATNDYKYSFYLAKSFLTKERGNHSLFPKRFYSVQNKDDSALGNFRMDFIT